MIRFDDLQINPDGNTAFFLPMRLRMMLMNELEKADIDIHHKLISHRQIQKSAEMLTTYAPYQKAAYKAFTDCGYDPAMTPDCYDALVSDVEPNYLFEKLKLFYGDTIDPDFAAQLEGETFSVKNDADGEPAVKPAVPTKRFDVIGSDEDVRAFNSLVSEKDLTEEDCLTVLHTLRLKIFPAV